MLRCLAVIASLWLMASACRPGAVEQGAAFRSLRRVALASDSELPAGDLGLTAYVSEVGGAGEGTWLEVSDPDDQSEPMLLVYGTAADAALASRLQGRTVELEFRVTGRITLKEGREALRIDLTGMRAVESSTPNEVP